MRKELENLRNQVLAYVSTHIKTRDSHREIITRVEELFDKIEDVLEGKTSAYEEEFKKYDRDMVETPGVKPRGIGIKQIEGIGAAFANRLKKAGVTTSIDLLDIGASPRGRKELARETGTSAQMILNWVNLADLARVKGVGEEYTVLLEAAGVDTVPELAQRNPANLHQRMLEVNEEKQLVRRVPSQVEVQDWVAQAKELPRIIHY